MRVYGLKPEEQRQVKDLLQKHFGDLDDVKVYLFGSRAKGKHKPFSDIDLAVKSKSKDLSNRIALFQEDWEKSNLPYKADITSWKDLFKPYLPEIRKTKKVFWRPEERMVHPWRACPYGEHWVVRHPRYPVGRQIQDVDGHCRRNLSGKDRLDGQEIDLISHLPAFQMSSPLPGIYPGKKAPANANAFDVLISGWCKYWNEVLKPDKLITPNFVKALIESESTFRPFVATKVKNNKGMARGLIQITDETLRILKDRKGEIKDHYIDLTREELLDPSKNICAGIRWLFRKREILQKRLSRSPEWLETIAEYKGIGPDLKKGGKKSKEVLETFMKYYGAYND
jgi:predicted nucleotidyltransferase